MKEGKVMIRKTPSLILGAILLIAIGSCTQSEPRRVVIDTYKATTAFARVDTFISIFGPSGDTTEDVTPNLWNGNVSPFTVDGAVAIAEADDGNPLFAKFARLDLLLDPGTYYIRVRAETSDLEGPYAIRILSAPDEDYTLWYFAATNPTDVDPGLVSYETDDTPPSGGIPTKPVPIGIGERCNRYLDVGDVDWFVLTVP
jgi:hypothetical protein